MLSFSPLSFAEVTNFYFSSEPQSNFGQSTLVQARPVPEETRPEEPVQAETVIQERPRGIVNQNPSSERSHVIAAKGGEPGTHECGQAIEINNMSGQCNEIEYDRDFLSFLYTEGLACARQAGQAAFGFAPTRIKLKTLEGQVQQNRRSTNGKYSTHSAGRALDVFAVEIYNGAAHNTVTMHGSYMDRRGHRTFYTGFRDCWKRAIQAERGDTAGSCGSGCLDFNDANHWDHMHISLPPRDSNRSRYGLNCT